MFSLLHLLSYVGAVAAFLFVTLSLASGLLWLAELIEEHSRYAKIVGMRGIYTIIGLHVLLLYTDALPAIPIFFSIACHLIYLSNFTSSWPVISLSSPRFLASCLLVIGDHFTWFFHFANKANEAKRRSPNRYSYGADRKAMKFEGDHGFMDVAAFFGICVWAAPLFLFLSLSANDNALPSMGSSAPPTPSGSTFDLTSTYPNGTPSSLRRPSLPRTSLLKSILVPLVSLLPRLRRRKRNDDEGLLAPRTPLRGSPLHSPVHMGNNGGSGYFPWSSDGPSSRAGTPMSNPGSAIYGGSGSGFSGLGGSSLSPETAKKAIPPLIRPPGPPRKVQSEMHITKSQPPNPRGLATRNGVPVVPDAILKEQDKAVAIAAASIGRSTSAMSRSSSGMGPPAMSTGPNGGERVGGAEILDSGISGLTRRKAD